MASVRRRRLSRLRAIEVVQHPLHARAGATAGWHWRHRQQFPSRLRGHSLRRSEWWAGRPWRSGRKEVCADAAAGRRDADLPRVISRVQVSRGNTSSDAIRRHPRLRRRTTRWRDGSGRKRLESRAPDCPHSGSYLVLALFGRESLIPGLPDSWRVSRDGQHLPDSAEQLKHPPIESVGLALAARLHRQPHDRLGVRRPHVNPAFGNAIFRPSVRSAR